MVRKLFLKFLVIITKTYIFILSAGIFSGNFLYMLCQAPYYKKNAIKCFLAIFWGLAQFFSYFDPIIPLQEFVKFCPKAEEERA